MKLLVTRPMTDRATASIAAQFDALLPDCRSLALALHDCRREGAFTRMSRRMCTHMSIRNGRMYMVGILVSTCVSTCVTTLIVMAY